eukprot:UN06262
MDDTQVQQQENQQDPSSSSSHPRPLTTLPDVDNLTPEQIADLIRQAEDNGVPETD